jgi:hypothetical protein
MNWKQLYTSSTPTERDEITELLLQRIAENKKPWPQRDRRKRRAHMIGDRRILEPVLHRNTPRVTAVAIGSTALVVTTAALLGQTDPRSILIIPAFGLYAALVLVVRQVKLQTA